MIRILGTRCAGILALFLALTPSLVMGQESWDAIYIGGAKVGHVHLQVEPVKDKTGRPLVRVRVDWELNFARGRNQARMRLLYGTIETPEGEVLRLDTRTQAAENDLRTYGDVIDGVMKLKTEAGGNIQEVNIPWGSDVRGPYAAELSLSRNPIKPGETRSLKTYVPDINKICTTKLAAKNLEDVIIGQKNQVRSLLRIEQTVHDENDKPIPGTSSTLWIDERGQILKTHTDLLGGMDTYRTTKAGALGQGGGPAFNLLAKSIIKAPRPIPGAENSRNIVYKISMEEDDPAEVFIADRRQTVKEQVSKNVTTLEVKTAGVDAGEAEPAPGEEFLRPNPLINSDSPLVVKHMRDAVKGETDPWKQAVAIQSWVAKNVSDKNFSVAFAQAAEVAKNLRGDCSEHSVLVAAMCRAARIPTRCVVGLVYAQNLGGFGPHMWNEVYVNQRWVAIDAAYDQSEVDATHLKLAATSMDGVAPFEAFLPVLKVFGKIKIEPLEIR